MIKRGITASKNALCLLFVLTPLTGAAQDPWQKLQLLGAISPNLSKDAIIQVIAQSESKNCSTYNSPAGTLCEAYIKHGTQSAVVQIQMRGYKKYDLTIPTLRYEKDIAKVTIGKIQLVRSELPEIKRIVESKGADGSRRFELTLHNALPKDILIKGAQVTAFRKGDGSLCCCPPSAIFKIDQNLVVSAGGKSNLGTKGSYVETVRGSDFAVQTSGEIVNSRCNDSLRLSLSLPVSFVVPKSSYSAVQFVLPAEFAIKDAGYSFTDPKFPPKEKPTPKGRNKVGLFTSFGFALTPEDSQELDISAVFPDNVRLGPWLD